MIKPMFESTYCFADIPVRIRHHYSYLAEQCRDYLCDAAPTMEINITEKELERERERAEIPNSPDPYLESLACYRTFCERVVDQRVLLFHSSAIAVDGRAYLFAAPSGTGKSTHTALWRRVLGDRAVMVNDDKPLLRLADDNVLVYGTPWDGKHRLSNRISVPVGGICFLSRGQENRIHRVSPNEGLAHLLEQTFRPESTQGMEKMLGLLIDLCMRVPLWSLACNISEEAAKLSYHTMRGEFES